MQVKSAHSDYADSSPSPHPTTSTVNMKYSLVGIKRFVLVAVLLSSLAVAAVSATDLDVSMDGLAIFIVMELAGAAFTAFTISILYAFCSSHRFEMLD